MKQERNELVSLLQSLSGISQSPAFHPEGDALFHSLQVFDHALASTRDPVLLAAALFHDVGKAIDGPTHDVEGAELLDGLLDTEVCWLVAHHLDLLREPAKTKRRLAGTSRLSLLQQLRRFDLAGRDPTARVRDETWAVDTLFSIAAERGATLVPTAPKGGHE
jgi:HD superfamily phosphodiesterase